jgi:hypothetical protein
MLRKEGQAPLDSGGMASPQRELVATSQANPLLRRSETLRYTTPKKVRPLPLKGLSPLLYGHPEGRSPNVYRRAYLVSVRAPCRVSSR